MSFPFLEDRIVKDGVRKSRQLALTELVLCAFSRSRTANRREYPQAVQGLNKAIDRADRLPLGVRRALNDPRGLHPSGNLQRSLSNCSGIEARPKTVARRNISNDGEQNSPNAVTKEEAAEIAADFMRHSITYRSEHWRLRNFGQRPLHSG
jgi:hypothetical protein